MGGRIGVALEAPPQSHNEVVDRARGRKHLVAPDLIENILPPHDAARVFRQDLQDHRLLVGERMFRPVPCMGSVGAKVDLVAAEAQLGGGFVVPLGATQDGNDPEQQFLQVEGFDEVIVTARLETVDTIFGGAANREEQHRRLDALPA